MIPLYVQLVEHFRTQKETAARLNVDQSTVSGWVRGSHGMSPAVAIRAERVTDGLFTRQQLCPDFPWDTAA